MSTNACHAYNLLSSAYLGVYFISRGVGMARCAQGSIEGFEAEGSIIAQQVIKRRGCIKIKFMYEVQCVRP